MDDLIFYLLLLLFVAVIALVIVQALGRRRADRDHVERARELSLQKGWDFTPSPAWDRILLYHIRGRGAEAKWEMDFGRFHTGARGGGRVDRLRWRTTVGASLEDKVFIAPAPPGPPVPAGFKIGSGVNQWMWSFILSVYGVGDLSGLESREAGSQDFRKRYVAFSRSSEGAARILTPEVERLLTAWPESQNPLETPMLVADADGIRLHIHTDKVFNEARRFERTLELGFALARTQRNLSL